MRIQQITSKFPVGGQHLGQWYCSDFVMGVDGEPIHRYLQFDGKWGKNSAYFNSKEDIEKALALGFKPDFSLSENEQRSREAMKAWLDDEQQMEDEYQTREMMGDFDDSY